MGNRRLYKIQSLHTVGMPESERLKVTALNLFYPTASSPFKKVGFFILQHSLEGEGNRYLPPPSEGRGCEKIDSPGG
jgi:hypothetical protein